MAHLPALMTSTQYANRVMKTSLNALEEAAFDEFAADASALIRQVAETDFMTEGDPPALDVPDGIIPVAFRVIDRAMENRLGLGVQVDGTFTAQKPGITGGQAGVYLTDQDESDIRRALDPPDTGFVAVPMSNFDLPQVSS